MLLTGRLLRELTLFHNLPKWPQPLLEDLKRNCTVKENFISQVEENELLNEIEPHMKRLKYEKDHWDDAIYLFRERESKRWNEHNTNVIRRIQEASLPPDAIKLSYIHILDLAKDGHIKPHIDSIRYCGTTISGVSLLSSCVMRLRHKEIEELFVDLLLPRRSLYKLSNIGRYDFTHEVLSNEESKFMGEKIERDRRISVICRDLPKAQEPKLPEFKRL